MSALAPQHFSLKTLERLLMSRSTTPYIASRLLPVLLYALQAKFTVAQTLRLLATAVMGPLAAGCVQRGLSEHIDPESQVTARNIAYVGLVGCYLLGWIPGGLVVELAAFGLMAANEYVCAATSVGRFFRRHRTLDRIKDFLVVLAADVPAWLWSTTCSGASCIPGLLDGAGSNPSNPSTALHQNLQPGQCAWTVQPAPAAAAAAANTSATLTGVCRLPPGQVAPGVSDEVAILCPGPEPCRVMWGAHTDGPFPQAPADSGDLASTLLTRPWRRGVSRHTDAPAGARAPAPAPLSGAAPPPGQPCPTADDLSTDYASIIAPVVALSELRMAGEPRIQALVERTFATFHHESGPCNLVVAQALAAAATAQQQLRCLGNLLLDIPHSVPLLSQSTHARTRAAGHAAGLAACYAQVPETLVRLLSTGAPRIQVVAPDGGHLWPVGGDGPPISEALARAVTPPRAAAMAAPGPGEYGSLADFPWVDVGYPTTFTPSCPQSWAICAVRFPLRDFAMASQDWSWTTRARSIALWTPNTVVHQIHFDRGNPEVYFRLDPARAPQNPQQVLLTAAGSYLQDGGRALRAFVQAPATASLRADRNQTYTRLVNWLDGLRHSGTSPTDQCWNVRQAGNTAVGTGVSPLEAR